MGTPGTPQNSLSDIRFKQYKLFVHSAENNSSQRETTQRYYTTVHISLATLLAIVGGYGLLTQGTAPDKLVPGSAILAQVQGPVVFVICILGAGLSILWRIHLSKYSRLNSAKFKVINAMEGSLPFQPFTDEWDILTGKVGAKKKRYIRLTTIEGIVPFISIAFYVALGLIYFAITLKWSIPLPS